MNLNDLEMFFAIVRHKSYLEASRQLNIPRSTLSRRIQNLERDLNVQLLRRSTRQVTPTKIGMELYLKCSSPLYELTKRLSSVMDSSDGFHWKYKISMPYRAGLDFLAEWVIEFASAQPGIQFEIEFSNKNQSLIEEKVDLAFRVGPLEDSNDVAKFLWNIPYGLFASKEFVARYGLDTDAFPANDLESLPCLVARPMLTWKFIGSAYNRIIRPNNIFTFDDMMPAKIACERGLGIAYLPGDMIDKNSLRLVQLRLAEDLQPIIRKMYAYYTKQEFQSSVIQLLIEFIARKRLEVYDSADKFRH